MHYVLGIEFKGNQLKIAAFKKVRRDLELVKLDTLIIPVSADETSRQLTAWVAANLTDQSSVKAVLTLSESALYLKELEFPSLLGEKMNEAVYWEVPSVAPIPQGDAVFDWQIVSESKGVQQVLVVVGKSYIIQNLITTFRSALIDIVAIEPSACALARAANTAFDKTTLVCLVEEQGTDYIVLENGLPVFTSSITGQSQSAKIAQIQSPTDLANDIASEGGKVIGYWQTKEAAAIGQVLVTGDLFYRFLGLTQLNLFSPLPTFTGTVKKTKHIITDSYQEMEKAGYLIAIGAGARHGQTEVLEGINLFPAGEKAKSAKLRTQHKQAAQVISYALANVVVLIAISASIFAATLWWYSLEKRSMALTETLAATSPTVLINEINSTNTAILNVIQLSNRQVNSGERLERIAALIPQTLKLTQINVTREKTEKWLIEGVGDRDSVLVYQKKLTDEAGASRVELAYSSMNKNTEDNEFMLTIIW